MSIVLLHGVGLSPALFDPLIGELQAMSPAVPVSAPLRLGYRGDVAPHDLAEGVTDLIAATHSLGHAIVVGVDAGASVALAAALTGARSLAAVVAHEPAVGPLAPALHRIVTERAQQLADTPGPDGMATFLTSFVGPDAWAAVPAEVRAFATEHEAAIRADVNALSGFALSAVAVAGLRTPVTVTTGQRSGGTRHAAAAALACVGRLRIEVVPGAGPLAPWEHAAEYARVVRRALRQVSGPGA